MPFRVFTFLLVLVLLCTGFSSPVPAAPVGGADTATVSQAAGGMPERLADRSTDDRQPVDTAAQPCAETLADGQQALLMHGACAPVSALCMARPRPYAASARIAPYLDGPQRPPCAGSFVA